MAQEPEADELPAVELGGGWFAQLLTAEQWREAVRSGPLHAFTDYDPSTPFVYVISKVTPSTRLGNDDQGDDQGTFVAPCGVPEDTPEALYVALISATAHEALESVQIGGEPYFDPHTEVGAHMLERTLKTWLEWHSGKRVRLERPRPPKEPRSDVELTKAALHVNYEVSLLRSHAKSSEWDNATIEGFLLHARNLIEFLGWQPSSQPTDILATDFVPGWEPPTPTDPKFISGCLRKINKHLQHLTWERVSEALVNGDGPEFPYEEIHDLLRSAFAEFTRQAVVAQVPGEGLFSTALSGWPR